ncbi:hypothetical protein CYMTET_49949 [Cymbomonas tetramitiformis]|uniref:Uncharacterized protein n=1 Tax=Cymbomonas tetramitiformis TaxID=36881 RepID=A0AAE0BQU6_9CHLO|nr:hypothetical protein CYMTET_49949 [Cymbomonas tetramitiformis]
MHALFKSAKPHVSRRGPLVAACSLATFPAAATVVMAGTMFTAFCYAIFDARRRQCTPNITTGPVLNDLNSQALRKCPTLYDLYAPYPFLTNRHVETILAALLRSMPQINYGREVHKTSDGGAVALDSPELAWTRAGPRLDPALPEDSPILILLPGLTGGSQDSGHVIRWLQAWRVAVLEPPCERTARVAHGSSQATPPDSCTWGAELLEPPYQTTA